MAQIQNKLGPYELNTIVTGDARELAKAIPDESVDLIFTDPVYDRIEDYEWLAETAVRVLKPSGALLCWSNGYWHYKNTKWLESKKCLVYKWTFAVVTTATSAPMNGKIIAKVNRLIWFNKSKTERFMLNYLVDGYGVFGGQWIIPRVKKKVHKSWGKSNIYTTMALKAFTKIDDIVFDPFTGGGTFPAVCKILNRQYLAFEIDPETAELARQRVANTQPPLPLVMPEQLELISVDSQ